MATLYYGKRTGNIGMSYCPNYDVSVIIKGFSLGGMLASLSALPPRSVVILHPAAHNPTGADPTREEWAAIADAMDQGELFPFFDSAYQVKH